MEQVTRLDCCCVTSNSFIEMADLHWGSVLNGLTADGVTAAAAVIALMAGFWAIKAKRRDDRRADRLNRVNRQLSDFYGKLSILYEAGMRDWCSFILQHGNDSKILGREFVRFFPFEEKEDEPITRFNPEAPNAEQLKAYRKWLRTLFLKTNERMLEVIYANADLIIGKSMPPVLILFAEHVASVRLMQLTLEEEELKEELGSKSVMLDDWRAYVKLMAPYPGDIGYYIGASFEVLKAEQERLLSTHDKPVTEKVIEARIIKSMWEKESYWNRKEYEARTAAGQVYEYKPLPKPEPEPRELGLVAWWRELIKA
jgi:hypothetical protein